MDLHGASPASVLLVDDDQIVLNSLAHGLSQFGYQVTACADAGKALRSYNDAPPDLAVLDIGLPDLPGTALAARMLAKRYRPILMLSGHTDLALVNEAIDSGVMGYLVKPVSARQLMPSIETARARFEDLRVRLARRFGDSSATMSQLEALIDQFAFAIFIIGRGHSILHRNRSAQHLLQDGALLLNHAGRLRVRDAARRDDFTRLLDSALGLNGRDKYQRALVLGATTEGHGAQAWAAALERGADLEDATAVLVVIDPDRGGTVSVGLLEALYGLTAKEAVLARALVRGRTLDNYCRDACISLNTARTHLKSIYRKTNTNRQVDLVRLLSQLLLALRESAG
jgi:DNA-binding NarL/FixJ family response regulator